LELKPAIDYVSTNWGRSTGYVNTGLAHLQSAPTQTQAASSISIITPYGQLA
jgi:hypothetical protein